MDWPTVSAFLWHWRNELTAAVIAAIWLGRGRGVNLCLVILFYYIAYLLPAALTADTVHVYYLLQMSLDGLIVFLCCQLSTFYQKFNRWAFLYSLIVFSSLVCDGFKLIDESAGLYILTWVHQTRQLFSIPMDLIFAAAGSNVICSNLLSDRAGTAYHMRCPSLRRLTGQKI